MVRNAVLYPLRTGIIILPSTLFTFICLKWVLKVLTCLYPHHISNPQLLSHCADMLSYTICKHGVYIQIDGKWPLTYYFSSVEVDRHLIIMCILQKPRVFLFTWSLCFAGDLRCYCFYMFIYFYKGSYRTTYGFFFALKLLDNV